MAPDENSSGRVAKKRKLMCTSEKLNMDRSNTEWDPASSDPGCEDDTASREQFTMWDPSTSPKVEAKTPRKGTNLTS
ncbi:hypothetical protein JTB14_002200 [Gonioctena quinquepunctata]|nr:hypothetical protein JTB14_002200 [Gonioctena quinquepunctata]